LHGKRKTTVSPHAKASEEAQARLLSQKRNSTVLSIVVSALVVVLLIIGLGILLLPTTTDDDVSFILFPSVKVDISDPPPHP